MHPKCPPQMEPEGDAHPSQWWETPPFNGIAALPNQLQTSVKAWPALGVDNACALRELAHESREKKEAHGRGWGRPFLLLVSMPPLLRAQWAAILGLPASVWAGANAHAQAFAILEGCAGHAVTGLHDRILKIAGPPPPPRAQMHAGNAWCLYPTLIADV